MRNYNLNIADYNIRFESLADGPELVPADRFLRNITVPTDFDIIIRVHTGVYPLPEDAENVFHAPFVEEINGVTIRHKSNFWSVWRHQSDLYIKTIFPLCPIEKNAVLRFALDTKEWELWIDCPDRNADPFEYPLDGLILYYLTVINSDIMIHASGINYKGQGYLFSGTSGKGKSTIAKLWEKAGATVIHDDRLIIRSVKGGYMMYNTPVYDNDESRKSPLGKLFLLDHGAENKLTDIKGANAVSLIMANCIQHNWDAGIITRLLNSVTTMCTIIPTAKFYFTPDRSAIDHILENE
jgi:hypothetical protein